MPVRPPNAGEGSHFDEHRTWIWPDGTRLARFEVPTDSAQRRTSLQQLRFIRELRARERGETPATDLIGLLEGDRSMRCDDDDSEDSPGPSGSSDVDMDTDGSVFQPLQHCSLLREGMSFQGRQQVSRTTIGKDEDWGVRVRIQELDLENGRCSGDMWAENVPQANSPVITYFEGEIIDNINNSFVTCKWGATYSIDLSHWAKFEAFAALKQRVMRLHGRHNKLHECPYIFMRWKERFFVNVSSDECGLTIAGFYYICMARATGAIQGYYYDPASTPYQKLELKLAQPLQSFSSTRFH